MRRIEIYALVVAIIGFSATWFLASSVLGMSGNIFAIAPFWYFVGLWAAFPALLAAINKRAAILFLLAVVSLLGLWAFYLSSMTSDGGIAMGIFLLAAIGTAVFGAASIFLRSIFLGKSNN
ncbi:MAG: hypothetical protein DI637_12755 [Citromicrobium sp.]|nr:MAG: hypothetical protein DI637_12755 [Citromicrobium sp.]